MAGKIARTLRHRDPQLLFGLVEAVGLHQCLAQKRMNAGLEIEQAKRFGGSADRPVEASGLEMYGSELRVHGGIFGIGFEGLLEEHARRLKIAELGKRAGDALVQSIT